jgi:NTP pyrophosphatase (non-canonical NTP hydrolase)
MSEFEDIWTKVVGVNDKFFAAWRLANPAYMTNALAGEIGEACNITKKLAGGGSHDRLTPEQLILKLKDEIADIFIYTILLSETIGMNYFGFRAMVSGKLDIVELRMKDFPVVNFNPTLENCQVCGKPLINSKFPTLYPISNDRFKICYHCASDIRSEMNEMDPPELDD